MSSKSKQEWQQNTLEPALKRSSERKRFVTSSEKEIDPLYTGEFPFT